MTHTIAIIEGNHEGLVSYQSDGAIYGAAEGFAACLSSLKDGLSFQFVRPHFADFTLSAEVFDEVDAVVFTGAAVRWSADDEEARPARAVMEAALAAQKPIFGSCYGMQLAVAVLGGRNRANPVATEFAIARDITLNEAGQNHPLYQGKPSSFEARAMHRDEVECLPEGALCLAGNAHSATQAMVYETDSQMVWGVQYHPELGFADIAAYIKKNDVSSFSDVMSFTRALNIDADFDEVITDLNQLDRGAAGDALYAKYQLRDTHKPSIHRRELINFLATL